MTRTHRAPASIRLVGALLLALGMLLAAAVPAAAQDVVVTADGLSAVEVTVEVGEPVDFLNEGDDEVRLTDDNGTWDSGPLGPGESFSISFDEPGTYTYASSDGSLSGVIIVVPAEEQPADDEGDVGNAGDEGEASDPDEGDPDDGADGDGGAGDEADAAGDQDDEAASGDEGDADGEGEGDEEAEPEGMADTGAPVVLLLGVVVGSLAAGTLLLRRTRS